MDSTQLYAEIFKIDEDQRLVFGYASTEARDQQGEIVRLDAIRRALPDYMRYGAVREMHQPSAVGTASEADVDHKGLWFGAKVVDDRAWTKVKEKVYKGFSIGGRVTSRDPDDRSVITGIDLTEISLVDRPANPQANFELVKRFDGGLRPQPLMKWDCGDATHQHATKVDASRCLEEAQRGFAKVQAEEHDMTTKTAAVAAQEADDALAKLANEMVVKGDGVNHATAAEQARIRMVQHEEAAADHEENARDFDREASTATAEGHPDVGAKNEASAKTHRETASLHRELGAGNKELMEHHVANMTAEKAIAFHRAGVGLVRKLRKAQIDSQDYVEMSAEQAVAWMNEHDLVVQHHQEQISMAERDAAEAKKAGNDARHTEMQSAAEGFATSMKLYKQLVEGYAKLKDAYAPFKPAPILKAADLKLVELRVGGKPRDVVKIYVLGADGNGYFGKREFSDDKRQELADKGHAMPDGSYPVENEEDLGNAVQAYGRAKDKEKVKAHLTARAKDLKATDKLPADWEGSTKDAAAKAGACEKCGKADGHEEKCEMVMKAAKRNVAKGLGSIATLANLLEQVKWLQQSSEVEQLYEHDAESEQPKKLEAWLSAGAALLRDIVTEETSELMSGEDVEMEASMAMVARAIEVPWQATVAGALREVALGKADFAARAPVKLLAERIEKAGARHSRADLARVQTIHDHACGLGATCAGATEKLAKAAGERDVAIAGLEKVTTTSRSLVAAVAEMKKRTDGLAVENGELKKRLATVEGQPVPPKIGRPLDRENDGAAAGGKSGSVRKTLDEIIAMPPGPEKTSEINKISYLPAVERKQA